MTNSKDGNRILGVDPGSRITGFGVIDCIQKEIVFKAAGPLVLSGLDFNSRLAVLFKELSAVIENYKPDIVVIEQIFVNVNVSSALKLGQARGVAMAAALNNNCILSEYSPRQVKQAVVGFGAATKEQVQTMVQSILKLPTLPQSDSADALAIAICHANVQMGWSGMIGYSPKGFKKRSNKRQLWKSYDKKVKGNVN